MLKKVFSVYDSKSESFTPPMINKTKGEALRSFQDEANNENSILHKHAADYTLMEIGEFDELKGQLLPYKANISLGNALEFVDAKK